MFEAMLIPLLVVVVSIAVVVWSADVFIDGAAATAATMGVSPLIIGLTIVGFGTSAPEILISIFSALQGNPGLAIGNAVGSNIANIALILGATTLLFPLFVQQRTVRSEMGLMTLATIVLCALLWDNTLSLLDGVVLLMLLAAVMGRTIYQGIHGSVDVPVEEESGSTTLGLALIKLLGGLALLLVSSRALVWGAVDIASTMGVSDLVIGLTIVAIGTSLPELAACIASAKRQAYQIAIGNIIGSNIFNALAVVGISAVIHPSTLPEGVLSRDAPVMLGLTFLMLALTLRRGDNPAYIGRLPGALLLIGFVAYQILLFWQNT